MYPEQVVTEMRQELTRLASKKWAPQKTWMRGQIDLAVSNGPTIYGMNGLSRLSIYVLVQYTVVLP
jgi:hypothetical protein